MSDDRNERSRHDVDAAGSAVSGTSRRGPGTVQKVGVAALIAIVLLSVIWFQQLNKAEKAARQPEVALAAGGAFRPAPAAPPPPALPAALPMPLPMPVTAPAPARASGPERREMSPAESPIFAFAGAGAEPASAPPAAAAAGDAKGSGEEPPATSLTSKLNPTVLRGSRASMLPHPDLLVTKGTMIPCILQTAIDTTLAGYIKCVLPQDVRSTTGNVVLLDRGTLVVGEIQGGITDGQDRVFVLWDRAETPDHAVIQLASPGTDELGRSGLQGAVDNHFWERFGGAILLSVVQGGLQSGTALASNVGGGSGTYFNSFQSNGQQISNTALQATINIPPTLSKNQGDTVAIFVARDLDFSDIYNLRRTGRAHGQ